MYVMDDNGTERKVVSRKEAIEKGLGRYFTGEPCKHGHISERYARGACVECESVRGKSDVVKEYYKEYRRANKEYIAEYNKEYYQSNKEHIAEYKKEYYQSNKEYRKGYDRKYYQSNKEYLIEYKKDYQRNRYETDPEYKLSITCRNMLQRTLKATSSTKDSRTYEMLGYCNEQLKQSIESKFLDGMSWDNYGETWHIDHVYPVSRYISEGITDPSIINSLDNLIPMWSEDNLEKSAQTLEEHLDSNPHKYDTYKHFLKEESNQ